MSEATFKSDVFSELRQRLPGCQIVRCDSSSQQGMPDHIVLWCGCWGALEFKKSVRARRQPNQAHYIQQLDEMSFAAFIFPENRTEVLDALEQAFRASRRACISES